MLVPMIVHLIKLVVGSNTLEEFATWQRDEVVMFEGKPANVVHTRNMPKQADEILKTGGSIYRTIKGRICCRQRIVGFQKTETPDGKPKCLILTDTEIMQTHSLSHRPFQGWRYFKEENTPKDMRPYVLGQETMPPEIEAGLREAGLL